MAGKICLSIQQNLKIYLNDYSNNNLNNLDSFPTWNEIYKKSKIVYDDYIDECLFLSVRTSNSFEQIEKLPFFKFRALTKSLKKYIELENKNKNGENDENGEISKQSDDMMNRAKGMIGKNKLPKMSIPKHK